MTLMILRSFCRLPTVLLSALVFSVHYSLADSQTFVCRLTEIQRVKIDLTPLKSVGEQTFNLTRDTSPTSTIDSLRFNLCDDLTQLRDVPENEQCPNDTRACLTMVNRKGDEVDRVVSVISLATSLNTTISNSTSSPKFISIIFDGPEYPLHTTPAAQSLNVTLICDPEADSKPVFKSYDGAQVQVEWSTKAGCPVQIDDGPMDGGGDKPDKDGETSGTAGSGVGWFFLVLLLAFAAYFGLGAYYNYSNYGASGADLIPHRDFWKEVPYMLNDVVSHLCSSVRPRRSSRGGYIAV